MYKTDPDKIKDSSVRLGYKQALKEYKDEIAIGDSILRVLDERYQQFQDDDY